MVRPFPAWGRDYLVHLGPDKARVVLKVRKDLVLEHGVRSGGGWLHFKGAASSSREAEAPWSSSAPRPGLGWAALATGIENEMPFTWYIGHDRCIKRTCMTDKQVLLLYLSRGKDCLGRYLLSAAEPGRTSF